MTEDQGGVIAVEGRTPGELAEKMTALKKTHRVHSSQTHFAAGYDHGIFWEHHVAYVYHYGPRELQTTTKAVPGLKA